MIKNVIEIFVQLAPDPVENRIQQCWGGGEYFTLLLVVNNIVRCYNSSQVDSGNQVHNQKQCFPNNNVAW